MRYFLISLLCAFTLFVGGCKDEPTAVSKSGTISGTITSDSGATLQGAFVITQPGTSSVTTDNVGAYKIENVSAGTYTVTASKIGYFDRSVSITVNGGQTTTANIVLTSKGPNKAPELPHNPSCGDSATVYEGDTVNVSWICSDPDADDLTYELRYGTALPLKSSDTISTSLKIAGATFSHFTAGNTYYWQVIARDSHGHVSSGPIWKLKCVSEYAISLDENAYLEVADNESLSLSPGSFTVEFWFKPAKLGSDFSWVVDKGSSNPTIDYLVGLDYFYNSGRIRFISRGLANDLISTTVPAVGTWYHVAAVQDIAAGKVSLYVNGVLESQTTLKGSGVTNKDSLLIGARFGATLIAGESFSGLIDEVRIWNVARSNNEIRSNMNSHVNPNSTQLVSYFTMNEGQGKETQDKSINHFNASIVGKSSWVHSSMPPK